MTLVCITLIAALFAKMINGKVKVLKTVISKLLYGAIIRLLNEVLIPILLGGFLFALYEEGHVTLQIIFAIYFLFLYTCLLII